MQFKLEPGQLFYVRIPFCPEIFILDKTIYVKKNDFDIQEGAVKSSNLDKIASGNLAVTLLINMED